MSATYFECIKNTQGMEGWEGQMGGGREGQMDQNAIKQVE